MFKTKFWIHNEHKGNSIWFCKCSTDTSVWVNWIKNISRRCCDLVIKPSLLLVLFCSIVSVAWTDHPANYKALACHRAVPQSIGLAQEESWEMHTAAKSSLTLEHYERFTWWLSHDLSLFSSKTRSQGQQSGQDTSWLTLLPVCSSVFGLGVTDSMKACWNSILHTVSVFMCRKLFICAAFYMCIFATFTYSG